MVFIALPALQRSQRDTQRKNDMSRVKSAIDNYRSANMGKMPGVSGSLQFLNDGTPTYGSFWNYIGSPGDKFSDPGGKTYSLGRNNADKNEKQYPLTTYSENPSQYYSYIYVYIVGNSDTHWTTSRGFKCSDDGAVERVSGSNRYAIQMALESGGIYCIDG